MGAHMSVIYSSTALADSYCLLSLFVIPCFIVLDKYSYFIVRVRPKVVTSSSTIISNSIFRALLLQSFAILNALAEVVVVAFSRNCLHLMVG